MSDEKEQFSKMQYFTVATPKRGKDLEMVKNMLLCTNTENRPAEVVDDEGESPSEFADLTPEQLAEIEVYEREMEEGWITHRIFFKICGQVYLFDHNQRGCKDVDPSSYAVDFDCDPPRSETLKYNYKFYPDMAEIWLCQKDVGDRSVIGLVEEDKEEETK